MQNKTKKLPIKESDKIPPIHRERVLDTKIVPISGEIHLFHVVITWRSFKFILFEDFI